MNRNEWKGVIHTLEQVSEYYDLMNDLATFFQADKWRKSAIKDLKDEMSILEIGSGPGSFLQMLEKGKIVALDPSKKLLSVSRERVGERASFATGISESLPFRENSFDLIFCSFSFRDFKDRALSLNEMRRILREDGVLKIVDIARYRKGLRSLLMKIHLKFIVPAIARIMIPRKLRMQWGRNPYKALWETYAVFETAEEISSMMRDTGFRNIVLRYLSLRGAFLICAGRA
ncbi:MAG: class I SAM-dependent methyltransferase [Thermoplasmata archaeon]|nr:class I SAM-dependent methyltransferase [Thermoplasmata archaeon]